MAPKRTLYEFCDRCADRSRQLTFHDGGRVWYTPCKCRRVPGPLSPPIEVNPHSFNIVRNGPPSQPNPAPAEEQR